MTGSGGWLKIKVILDYVEDIEYQDEDKGVSEDYSVCETPRSTERSARWPDGWGSVVGGAGAAGVRGAGDGTGNGVYADWIVFRDAMRRHTARHLYSQSYPF